MRPGLAIAVAAIVALATVAAYAPAWQGAFVYDDIAEIAENPAIRRLWPPWVPMFEGTPTPHRPLPYYTFAVNYAVHGLDPRGYHAVNLAIHLANGWLLWWIVREVVGRLGTDRDRAALIAAASATLWLVHPLCTQAVAYVYQRIESLAALAMLMTLACFLRAFAAAKPGRWLVASVAASSLGMLCKEHVAAAPITVLLLDWLVVHWRPDAPWRSLTNAMRTRPWYYAALFATPLIAFGLVIVQRDRYTDFKQTLAGPLLYAANQPLVIGEYLGLAVWPGCQCLDWYRPPIKNPAILATGIVALLAALGLAAWGVGRSRSRGLALAILLFLALLAPTSSFLPVNDLMVEHRMYLPLAVVCVVIAAFGNGLMGRHVARPWRQWVWTTTVTAVSLALAVTTWARCHAYQSRLVMWADVVTKAPGNPRGWQTLALEVWQAGAPEQALEAVDRSLAIVPQAPMSQLTRAGILLDLGRPAEAVEAADRAIALDPRVPEAHRVREAAVEARHEVEGK